MSPTKVFICNECNHNTSKQLCSILSSGFNFDVEVVKDIQELKNSKFRENAGILFCVLDEASNREIDEAVVNSTCPRIFVLCGKAFKGEILEELADHFDDFILTPLREEEIAGRIRRLIGTLRKREIEEVKKNILQKMGMAQVIGHDPVFLEAISNIPLVAASDATIHLSGETGVGKEVCARAIHYLSERSDQSFIAVNCGTIPGNLVENELFGHKRGAFTDARSNQVGLVAEAERGTLFLDEIDTLSLEAQSKLLRLLQDKTYRLLGHSKPVEANIRVITASNADLKQKIVAGTFRQDLFYRLSIPIHLPSLRERVRDIVPLANHFLKKHGNPAERENKYLTRSAIRKLTLYDWPGNIRELENVIQQAILLSRGPAIQPQCINIPVSNEESISTDLSYTAAKKKYVSAFEKEYISQLLASCSGNISCAARKAKKDRADFSRLIKKNNIDPEVFK